MMGMQSGQIQMVILDIDAMIPDNHLLRQIKNCVNFDFYNRKVLRMHLIFSADKAPSGKIILEKRYSCDMIDISEWKGQGDMRYGKIQLENGNLIFTKRVKTNLLPCSEILWAYRRKEDPAKNAGYSDSVCVVTRLRKKYKFEMNQEEAVACLKELQKLNPRMASGFPRGARISFQGLPNTRDLGALKAKDGRMILPRRLLRSGDLYHLSYEDQKTLREEYRLTKVIDLRTERERERKPDTVSPGVEYVYNPILDEDTMGITRERRPVNEAIDPQNDMGEFLEKIYQNLVLEPYAVDQYAKFFDELLHQGDGAVLYHCSAGKDRVGVGTALLLSALGIPRPVIMADFLRTNGYFEAETHYLIQHLETKMVVSSRIYSNIQALFSVRRTYLESIFAAIDRNYGSMENFLRKKMYLSPKVLEQLQSHYLV